MSPKHAPMILVVIISLGFFGMMTILAFHSVPAENKDALEAMLGILATSFSGLIGYYFGSSAAKPSPPAPIAALAPAEAPAPPQEGQ